MFGQRLWGRHRKLAREPLTDVGGRATFDGDWAQERTRLANEGKYVFDEIARVTADLLERVPAVRRLFSDRFPLVIVDE